MALQTGTKTDTSAEPKVYYLAQERYGDQPRLRIEGTLLCDFIDPASPEGGTWRSRLFRTTDGRPVVHHVRTRSGIDEDVRCETYGSFPEILNANWDRLTRELLRSFAVLQGDAELLAATWQDPDDILPTMQDLVHMDYRSPIVQLQPHDGKGIVFAPVGEVEHLYLPPSRDYGGDGYRIWKTESGQYVLALYSIDRVRGRWEQPTDEDWHLLEATIHTTPDEVRQVLTRREDYFGDRTAPPKPALRLLEKAAAVWPEFESVAYDTLPPLEAEQPVEEDEPPPPEVTTYGEPRRLGPAYRDLYEFLSDHRTDMTHDGEGIALAIAYLAESIRDGITTFDGGGA